MIDIQLALTRRCEVCVVDDKGSVDQRLVMFLHRSLPWGVP